MDKIIYEHPLNERIRIFLRLEHLFKQANYFVNQETIWDCTNYCVSLIEIMDILERNDIRTEICKELEKQIKFLKSLENLKHVDKELLANIILKLNDKLENIKNKNWKLAKRLREDHILKSIQKRIALYNTIYSFDSPSFHYWINQPKEMKQKKFLEWQEELNVVYGSIKLILDIIRDGGFFKSKIAKEGFYQQDLDTNSSQLVRIALPKEPKAYPQISGDKHRVSIRFFNYSEVVEEQKIIEKDIEFEMCC